MLVCEDSLCPGKQPDVSGPGLGEAGRYSRSPGDSPWLGSGGGWLVVLPTRYGRGGALGPCWQGGAEDPWVLEVLSWRT